jgi:hypothetical protein
MTTTIETLELPFMQMDFQKDLQVLFCRWRMPVDLRQFTEGYMATLQFAAQQQAHFWLYDLRLRNTSSETERNWFVSTFVPAVRSALGKGNFIAYLMSPMQREAVVPEEKRSPEPVKFSDSLTARFFTNEHDALEWLNSCRILEVMC